MPPLVYEIAGGRFSLPAMVLMAIAIVTFTLARSAWVRISGLILFVAAVATVAVSAVALPWWCDVVWAVAVLGWLCVARATPGRLARRRVMAATAALGCTAAAAAIDLSNQITVPLPVGRADTLYVVGDSISAGLGRTGAGTWPTFLRQSHGVRVVNLSRAGSTIRQAVATVTQARPGPGVVLIEVGGNDVIGHASPDQFGADLDALARLAVGLGRQVVMVELPRFPFDDAYGIRQRQVARRFGVRLIPRRFFAAVLARPGATVDGVHLSPAGQRHFAEIVWRVVGPAMGG